MDKIKTKEDVERGQKKLKILVGGFLVFLMVFSTAGYAIFLGGYGGGKTGTSNQDSDGNLVQNGLIHNGQYWVLDTGNSQFYFVNHLDSVKDIPVDINLNANSYIGSPLFLVDLDSTGLSIVSTNLGRYASRVQTSCYGPCEEDLPEKNCTENLIIYRETEEKRVYQEDKCVFIEGDIGSVDAFLYKTLGLI